MNKKHFLITLLILALTLALAVSAGATETVVVTTAEELLEVMANGGNVKLGADIALPADRTSVNIYEDIDVVVDLAGYTVTDEKGEWYVLGNGSLTMKDTVGGGAFDGYIYVCGSEFVLEGGSVSYVGLCECGAVDMKGGNLDLVFMWTGDDCEPLGKANLTVAEGATVSIADIEVDGENFLFGSDPAAHLPGGYNATKKDDGTWVISENILSGTGTQADPYLIEDVYDLKDLRDMVNDGKLAEGTYVSLETDIDLGNMEWTAIGSSNYFMGIFEGNGHTISNLKSTNTSGYRGLFGLVYDADNGIVGGVIRNVNIKNAQVFGNNFVGVIAAYAFTGRIENCHVSGTIQVTGDWYTGVINGYGYASILNCSVIADEGSDSYVHGGTRYIGGIAGFVGEGGVKIDNCTVKNMTITTGNGYVGGIAGIAQYGNQFTNNKLINVTIEGVEDAYMVGLMFGNSTGNGSSPSVLTGNTMINTTGTAGDKEINTLWGMDVVSVVNGEAFGVTDEDGLTTFYNSIEAAINNAEQGQTVTLYNDCVVADTLQIGGLTLDGNGHTISDADDFNSMWLIMAEKDANIKDLTLQINDMEIRAGGVAVLNANAVIENLTVTGSDGESFGLGMDGATVTVNGLQTSGNGMTGIYVTGSENNTKLTLADAVIEEENSLLVSDFAENVKVEVIIENGTYQNVEVEDGASLTIYGGTFAMDVTEYLADNAGCVETEDGFTVHIHDENKALAAENATCTVDGKTAGKACSVCDKVMVAQETIPAKHTLSKIDAKAPTYTEEGIIEHHYCSVCKKLFVNEAAKDELTAEQVIVPMLIKVEEEKAEVSEDAVDNAITEASKNETTTDIVLDLNKVAEDAVKDTQEKPAEVVTVQLPVASLEKVAELDEKATLTVTMKEATVTMDVATLEAVTKQAEGSTVTLVVEQIPVEELTDKQQAAVENKEVVETISAQIICDATGNTISDFDGGNVTVQIPFTPEEGTKGEDYAVYYVADDGSIEKIETKYVDGHLVVTLEHFSEYVIVNTKANADPSNPATGALSVAPVMALLVINSIGAGALIIGKKRFF